MESTTSVNAEDREALRAIEVSIARLQPIVSAYEFDPPPSAYGPYVDAVGRKAAEYWVLSELARVGIRLAALKRRLTARRAQALADAGETPSGR
ncbi:hypothetical protein [Arthrobacter sp. BE255]|uniref:hypothetical protein n=1 Tax=Arthrobacter sp. BE255 TaxID=2817721 RepID=UPI00285FF309|nr:hypothetical protein [Arthrobacter sp. BE255]MDR7161437.1 hypothetical protein [Arthrobacter sp. BE255]